MNIDILNTTLEVSENPGLDVLDPRFMEITTLVENGEYLEAAAKAEEIFTEEIYDIRLTGYFLYGFFLEQGVGAMPAILGCLANLFEENWDALGPVKNREKHAQTSLNWLFRQLLKKFQYEEGKDSDVYQQWIADVSSEEVQEALDASEALQRALGRALEDKASPLLDGLSKVVDWLKAFQRVVYREPEVEEEPEAAAEARETTAPAPLAFGDERVIAEGSYHLQLLLKKIHAFEQLVGEEDFLKAAIVADDINQIIANFDPRIYFPKIFSRYSLLLTLNIADISGYDEYKESLVWKTIQDLYKVDLESFVSFDSKMLFSSSPGEVEHEEYEEEETYEEPE